MSLGFFAGVVRLFRCFVLRFLFRVFYFFYSFLLAVHARANNRDHKFPTPFVICVFLTCALTDLVYLIWALFFVFGDVCFVCFLFFFLQFLFCFFFYTCDLAMS